MSFKLMTYMSKILALGLGVSMDRIGLDPYPDPFNFIGFGSDYSRMFYNIIHIWIRRIFGFSDRSPAPCIFKKI